MFYIRIQNSDSSNFVLTECFGKKMFAEIFVGNIPKQTQFLEYIKWSKMMSFLYKLAVSCGGF